MANQILIKPIISEKSEGLSEKLTKYSFVVARRANKVEIKKAIEKEFNVSVSKVNTMVMPSKSKSRNTKRGMQKGRVSAFKKAIITLAAGEEIDFFGEV